jgi:hypothetical protein
MSSLATIFKETTQRPEVNGLQDFGNGPSYSVSFCFALAFAASTSGWIFFFIAGSIWYAF